MGTRTNRTGKENSCLQLQPYSGAEIEALGGTKAKNVRPGDVCLDRAVWNLTRLVAETYLRLK